MKKMILLLGCLSLLGLGFVATSCSNDDDEWKGCFCIINFRDGGGERENLDANFIREEWGVNNCYDLERGIRNLSLEPGDRVTCSNL